MLSDKMTDALNQQINAEMYSSYLYLSMSADFEAKGLSGFAAWMAAQAREEYGHAMKIYGYIHEQMGRVQLGAIDAPPAEWGSPLEVFQETFKHEQKVTKLIHDLVGLARSENDYATENFLGWFVTEQVEEEASAADLRDKLEMIGDSKNGLFMLDRAAAQRGA